MRSLDCARDDRGRGRDDNKKGVGMTGGILFFEKEQKVMSFLSARMKELKKASTFPKAPPYMEGMQLIIWENRKFSDYTKVNRTIKEPV